MIKFEHISKEVSDKAPELLALIKDAKSVLLHCHPSPDPDSVGSALAMKFALEDMGKKVTVIKGDSPVPKGFVSFPGIGDIVLKSYIEIDPKDFDLFIIQDSGSKDMVSRKGEVSFPVGMKTVIIDHHASNPGFADLNLIDTTSPATAFILFQLFSFWNIELRREIALNLFMGMYTDTGGFKYQPCDYRILLAAAECARVAPDYTKVIFDMENSQSRENIYFQALALHSIETFCNDSVAISAVSSKELNEKHIPSDMIYGGEIANSLKSVVGWNIGVFMIEIEPHKIKMNFRSRDTEKYNVSKLAVALGGGGHRAAAGAGFSGTIDEAKHAVVSKIKELYNL